MPSYALESVAQAICSSLGYGYGGAIGQGTFKETFLTTTSEGTKQALKGVATGLFYIVGVRVRPEPHGDAAEVLSRLLNHPSVSLRIASLP